MARAGFRPVAPASAAPYRTAASSVDAMRFEPDPERRPCAIGHVSVQPDDAGMLRVELTFEPWRLRSVSTVGVVLALATWAVLFLPTGLPRVAVQSAIIASGILLSRAFVSRRMSRPRVRVAVLEALANAVADSIEADVGAKQAAIPAVRIAEDPYLEEESADTASAEPRRALRR